MKLDDGISITAGKIMYNINLATVAPNPIALEIGLDS